MRKNDGRTIDHTTLEWIRMKAVERVIEGKESPETVIKGFGLDRTNIYGWLRQYRVGGYAALKSTKAAGPQPKLSNGQRKKLGRMLMKNPQQLHFDFGLWTLEMVQELILKTFKVSVSYETVRRLLKAMGYSHQKPLYRAWQQDPARVKKWLEEEYPAIKAEAKRQKRTIFFEDEAGFNSADHRGKTWGKEGQRPIVKTSGARHRINAISAINAKGQIRFMLYEGSGNAALFVLFLKALLSGTGEQKITLIVDGHSMHKTKAVKDFVQKNKKRLKLYFLPPYSPELNPDEQVWNSSKGSVQRKKIGGKAHFIATVRSAMHTLQKHPSLIQSFFRHPDVAYAG
jgi:transposase